MLCSWFRGMSLMLLKKHGSSQGSPMLTGWYLSRALNIPCKSAQDKYPLNRLGVKTTFAGSWPPSYDLLYLWLNVGIVVMVQGQKRAAVKAWVCGHRISCVKVCKNLDLDPCLSDMTHDVLFNTAQSLWVSFSTNCEIGIMSVFQSRRGDGLRLGVRGPCDDLWVWFRCSRGFLVICDANALGSHLIGEKV